MAHKAAHIAKSAVTAVPKVAKAVVKTSMVAAPAMALMALENGPQIAAAGAKPHPR